MTQLWKFQYLILFTQFSKKIKTKKINIEALNNLNFSNIDLKRFPIVKILKLLPNKISLYETVLVSANDCLVDLFLNKKIKFNDISKTILKILKTKEFLKYKKKSPRNVEEIIELNNYVRFKILKKVYKS